MNLSVQQKEANLLDYLSERCFSRKILIHGLSYVYILRKLSRFENHDKTSYSLLAVREFHNTVVNCFNVSIVSTTDFNEKMLPFWPEFICVLQGLLFQHLTSKAACAL
jgi:hypothetical protein